MEITGVELDCNESYPNNYDQDCDVDLSYEVEKYFPDTSCLDVEVICRAKDKGIAPLRLC